MPTNRKRPSNGSIDVVAAPGTLRPLKSKVLSIRISADALMYMNQELAKLGVKGARHRQDFYRGAIFAGIINSRRASSASWKKFIQAVQPLALKHLGSGLVLDGADEIIQGG